MRKAASILFLLALWVLVNPPSSPATVTVNVQKAREFMAASEYRNAAALLQEVVVEEPGNAEAWVLMGVCSLYTGDLEGADRSFGKALSADATTSESIQSALSEFVVSRLSEGDQESAQKAFEMGLARMPSLGVKVTRSCVDGVQEKLDQGREEAADALFAFASGRDPSMRQRICDVLSARARESTGEQSLRYVILALHYGDKNQEETSKMALHLANEIKDEDRRAGYLMRAFDQIGVDRILESTINYYSSRWGQAERITLDAPEKWVSLRKAKSRRVVRYLAREHMLTRGEQGPTVLEPAAAVAGVLSGAETPIEGSYDTEVWFCMNRVPTEAYVWILD